MPTYTVVNDKTEEYDEMFCTWDELQNFLKENDGWRQELSRPPALISSTGNVINKTSGDWKDLMKNIKKGSGGGNNIKT